MRRARFAGVGAALPSRVVANAEIENRLGVADQGIRAGDYERVVVVGADCLSAFVDPSDRATAPLFGDGAGAVVLEVDADARPEARGILACRLRALGALWPILTAPIGNA